MNNNQVVKLLALMFCCGILTSCSIFLPHNPKSYDIAEEKAFLTITDFTSGNGKEYVTQLMDSDGFHKNGEDQCVDRLFKNYKEKLCNKKELSQDDFCKQTSTQVLPLVAPIVTGLASMVSDQIIKMTSKAIKDDQEKHSASYIGSLVKRDFFPTSDPFAPVVKEITLNRNTSKHTDKANSETSTSKSAMSLKIGLGLNGHYEEGACTKLTENFSNFDKQLSKELPTTPAGLKIAKENLINAHNGFMGFVKPKYSGVLVPISLQVNTAAAKVYQSRWWKWFPLFWYQLAIDSTNDMKITSIFSINNTAVKFDLPSYNLEASKVADYCTSSTECSSSYFISGLSPSNATKLQIQVTETDPTEIKAIGDSFEDITKKVFEEAQGKVKEEVKNF